MTARATFAYLDGDLASARADAERAMQIDPGFFRAHLRWASCIWRQAIPFER